MSFRTLLLSHWKNEIDNDSADLVNLHKKKNEILNAKNKEEKKHLKIELQYFVYQNRQVALDNIRFIDELFRVGTISEKVIHRWVRRLLIDPDAEEIESLCGLMCSMGKNLDTNKEQAT